MTKLFYFLIFTNIALLFSCNNPKRDDINRSTPDVPKQQLSDESTRVFQIEHGYIKYNSTKGLIREIWFDDYGRLQYEESYRMVNDKKDGSCSYVISGYKYDMQLGSTEMVRSPYKAEPATEYEKLSDEIKRQYEITKIGDESFNGKYCSVISFKKPIASTVWLYKGIPMKSVSNNGSEELTITAVDFSEEEVSSKKFELPENAQIVGF